MLSHRLTGHALAGFTAFVWGITFVSTKILLVEFTPLEILLFRFVLGYAALTLIMPRRLPPLGWKGELLFAGAGLCGITLYFLLENMALVYSYASNVGLIMCSAPFFTALLAHVTLKDEGLTRGFFAGFVVAMSGITLIAVNGNVNLHLNPLGDMLAAGAAVVWAVYSVLLRRIGALKAAPILVIRRIFLYGILFMLPLMGLMGFSWNFARFANPDNLLNMIFLGLGASALCFVTWTMAVNRLGAVGTSAYIYMVPVVTVAASAVILHENITPLALVGTALTLGGLVISEYARRH